MASVDYYKTNDDSGLYFTASILDPTLSENTWLAEVFSASETYVPTSLRVKLYRSDYAGGHSLGSVVIQLFSNTDASFYSAGELGYSDLSDNTDGVWVTVPLTITTGTGLVSGEEYAVVVNGSSTGWRTHWRIDSSGSTYDSGYAEWVGGGSGEHVLTGADFMFVVNKYGLAPPSARATKKRLIAAAGSTMFYEDID